MNRVCLVGELTEDVVLKYTAGHMPVAELKLSVEDMKKQSPLYYEIDVVAFGDLANSVKGLGAGSVVAVDAKLTTNNREYKANTYKNTNIIALNIHTLGGVTGVKEPTGSNNTWQGGSGGAVNLDDIPF